MTRMRPEARAARPSVMLRAALLAAACSLALSGCSPSEEELAGAVREERIEVGHLRLPDVTDPSFRASGLADEGELTFRAAPDRLLLVYFGFTHCPDVCPATLADLRVALRDVPASDDIDLVFVTVDPDRDTPEVLNGYLPYFADRFHVVAAPDSMLRPVADTFLVRYEVGRDEDGEVTEVAHTAVLYAVDDTGTVVVEWPFGTRAPQLASDLNILLGRR